MQAERSDDGRQTDEARLLERAKDPSGAQRFYPRGRHPAAARLRDQLAKLEAFRDAHAETPELQAAIADAEQQLAMFEAGEDRAKHHYLASHGL